jgi:hypothetical protein
VPIGTLKWFNPTKGYDFIQTMAATVRFSEGTRPGLCNVSAMTILLAPVSSRSQLEALSLFSQAEHSACCRAATG